MTGSVRALALGLMVGLLNCALPRGHVALHDQQTTDLARALGRCDMRWDVARHAVVARCHFPTLTLAQQRTGPRLAQLAHGDARSGPMDAALRATAEYRSLMDPYNVWQWRDRVTDAEALAACRLMLADMRAGQMIDWEYHARGYVVRVRQMQRQRMRSEPRRGVATRPAPAPNRPRANAPAPYAPKLPPGVSDERRPVREILDEIRTVLPELNRGGGISEGVADLARRLERTIEIAEAEAGAIAVIFAGVASVIVIVTVGGQAITYELGLGGTAATAASFDFPIAQKLGKPLLTDFAHQLEEIERLSSQLRASGMEPTIPDPRLTRIERISYRDLIHRPVAELTEAELRELQHLRRIGQIREPLIPGNATHKAQRWADYLDRAGEGSYDRWSPNYDENMRRSSRAHRKADRLHAELGWGEREVRVKVNDAGTITRVLDIGDEDGRRGIEVKTGYVTYDANVASQVRRDAILIRDKRWTIQWRVDGRCSKPLREALANAGISVEEAYPNMPIEKLRAQMRAQRGKESL